MAAPARGKHFFGDRAALPARKQAEDVAVELPDVFFKLLREGVRVQPGKVFPALRPARAFELDALVLQDLQIVIAERDGAHLLEFEHFGELVDEGVEGIGGRDDEHVARAQALVVVHEIAQAVEKDHRLAAARAALQHKALPLGAGDDLELLFLDGLDDVADGEIVLPVLQDAAKVRIEQDLLVAPRDLFGRQMIAHGEVLVAEGEDAPVLDGERPPQHGAVFVLVDGKADARLLVVPHGKGRAPVDDLQIDVPLLADIIAVVALFVVHDVDARKVGLDEIALVRIDLLLHFLLFRLLFEEFAVLTRRIPLPCAQPLHLRPDLADAALKAGEVIKAQHAKDSVEVLFFIAKLPFLVEESQIPCLIRIPLGIEHLFELFDRFLFHGSINRPRGEQLFTAAAHPKKRPALYYTIFRDKMEGVRAIFYNFFAEKKQVRKKRKKRRGGRGFAPRPPRRISIAILTFYARRTHA